LGTEQLFQIVSDIAEGRGDSQDLLLLADLSEAVKLGSLCGLGQTAPNPLLSAIRYFAHEYEAHVQRRTCPARVCIQAASEALAAGGRWKE
jgi:NADH:ubiquinone oxidoreductase subunit F (NADH-binding)